MSDPLCKEALIDEWLSNALRTANCNMHAWRIFGFTRDAISSSIPLLGYSSPATRFSHFVWLFAAKLLHDNGTELCRDVQALEDEDLALVGYMVVCNEVCNEVICTFLV